MKIKFLCNVRLFLVLAVLFLCFCNESAVATIRSKLSFFELKQTQATLENALKILDVDVIKKIVSQNKTLVNDESLDPLIYSVVRVNRQDKAQEQLELLDFLLNVEGVDVNRLARGASRQNTLDIAIKGIQLGRAEGTKKRYRALAKKLLDHGAVLSSLAENAVAQNLVKELSELSVGQELSTDNVASVAASQPDNDTAVLLSQHEAHLDFLSKKEHEEAEQLKNLESEIGFKRTRIESLQKKIALIEEQLS